MNRVFPLANSQAGSERDVKLLHLSGMFDYQRGNLAEALAQLLQAATIEPQSAQIQFDLGTVSLASGELVQAESAFRRACRLNSVWTLAWQNLATSLFRQKKMGEAVLVLQQALEHSPETTLLWHQLGVVWESAGRFQKARAAYEQAIEQGPPRFEHYNDLGSVLLKLELPQEAMRAFVKATELAPGLASAWSNLGAVLLQQKQFQASEISLKKAISTDPHFFGAYYNLANLYRETGRSDEAIELYQQAEKMQPENTDVLYNLALTLNTKGQFEQAAQTTRKLIQLAPQQTRGYSLLFTYNTSSVTPGEVQKLERLLSEASPQSAEQAEGHFALGAWYDQQKNYSQAFSCYQQANSLVARREKFSADLLRRQIDRLRNVFTPDYRDRCVNSQNGSEQPVFIVGMPRSGSTLVDQILTNHSQIKGVGEHEKLGELIARQLYPTRNQNSSSTAQEVYPELLLSAEQALLDEMARCYQESLVNAVGEAARITDKLPYNMFHLGLISLLFPNATIIYTRRHPLDVCLSCYFQNFSVSNEFSFDLKNLGEYYIQHDRLLRHWQMIMPGKIHTVDYEKLVLSPVEQSHRLIEDICQLPWEENCLRHEKNQRVVHTASLWQVRQPIHSRSIQRWRNYEQQLSPLRKQLEEAGIEFPEEN